MTEFIWKDEYNIGAAQIDAEHRKLHQAIVHEMNLIMEHSGNLDALVHKFKRLMTVWVIEHIIQEDKKISAPVHDT